MVHVLDSLDQDIDQEITKFNNSTKKIVISKLKELGLLQYGALINDDHIETILTKKQLECKNNDWIFLKLQVKEIIKNEGFFCTERGKNGEIYILKPDEMPNFNERKNRNAFEALKIRQRGLHMIDSSVLDSESKKKLEFEILRNSAFELEMSSKLKERCR